jgi:hypothetical protein
VWVFLLILLLAVFAAALLWRQHRARVRAEREREERRARTDQLLARVLLGEDHAERRTIRAAANIEPEQADRADVPVAGPAVAVQPVDIDLLLGDEPTSIAEQARRQLERPTTLISGREGESTLSREEVGSGSAPLSLLESRLDVPLDALVLSWFSARGYVMAPAPESAQPIRLLLTHGDDAVRCYAFYFERGRLHAQRAAALLEKAHALGMNRLLVAAEHGADPSVSSARLRDVLVMDWVALDGEMKKIDFRVAAKLVAIARSRRDLLGLA